MFLEKKDHMARVPETFELNQRNSAPSQKKKNSGLLIRPE
jgi:hypothetical protein